MKHLFIKILLFAFVMPLTAQAAQGVTLSADDISAKAAVLMDATTGEIVFEKNGDDIIPPASLTKLMTIHIALDEVAGGNASLDEVVPITRPSWAASQPPGSSLMYLANGHIVTLHELLLGLSINSGNDAAVAVALRFAPTVAEFAERMNKEARELGLTETYFVEPSGISAHNLTTAREFAQFAQAYINMHPEVLENYHSVREFIYPKAENLPPTYRANYSTVARQNRNTLLTTVEGVDGLKTGFIYESEYNIALTAKRDGTRFIAIILSAPNLRLRDEDGKKLLNWGFDNYRTFRPELPELEQVRIWKGMENFADIKALTEEMEFTIEINRGYNTYWEVEVAETIVAPLAEDSPVGELILYDSFGEFKRWPLVLAAEVQEGGFFKRLWDTIQLFFRSLFGE